MHALNGNPPPGGTPSGRQQADRPWRTLASRLDGRMLAELQPAGRLMAAGWTLPATLDKDYQVRVYDTRLEKAWLQRLLPELEQQRFDERRVVGGDFLTTPHLEDGPALSTQAVRRWGPVGTTPCHIFVPPRPHLASWLQRCQQQASMEAPGTQLSVCCIVPRERCPDRFDAGAIRKLIPQAAALLDDPELVIRLLAVGERPPLVRVPATERQLPPQRWEAAHLARNRVLVVLTISRHSGPRVAPSGVWIRGMLPPPPRSELELLRLEMILPPATRQSTAERIARAGLRKVAEAMRLPAPDPHQLRQLQPTHDGVAGILGVPPEAAQQWLQGSGCQGVYLRPFRTEHTSPSLDRSLFHLLWARGRLADGPRLWEAFKAEPGFAGLLPMGKDVAVRVTAAANVQELQALLRIALGDVQAQFRRAVPGQRWWKLGPLSDAERWHVKDMLAKTGLVPLRDELRYGKAGPFRVFVYFAAVGEPRCDSFDDGGWASSEARLYPADPPPRRPAKSLPPQATWGGPRQAPSPVPSVSRGSPQPQSKPPPGAAAPRQRKPALESVEFFPPLPVPAANSAPSGSRNETSGSRRRSAGSPGQQTSQASLEAKVDQLLQLLQQQGEELRQLRLENESLRAQLRGIQVHQPYAFPGPLVPHPTSASTSLPVVVESSGTRTPPRESMSAADEDVTMTLPKVTHPSEKGVSSPDPKRLRAVEAPKGDDV